MPDPPPAPIVMSNASIDRAVDIEWSVAQSHGAVIIGYTIQCYSLGHVAIETKEEENANEKNTEGEKKEGEKKDEGEKKEEKKKLKKMTVLN